MTRPHDNEACSVCIDAVRQCDAADFGEPGKTHLQFMYDLQQSRVDTSDFDAHLIRYALNRYLAPFRDNWNKKNGKPAERTYKSRNMKVKEVLGKICGLRVNGRICIRTHHPHEPDKHKF